MDNTVPKNPQTPDIPEPPLGSIVLDRDGLAWQRTLPVLVDVAIDCWERAGLEAFGQSFEWLTLNAGPLTVVYTPAGDPASGRYVLHATTVMTGLRDGRLVLSLAGPVGSVDVELHPSDLMELAEDLNARLTGGPAVLPEPPALAVYVVEDRDSAGVGPWHRHDQTAYPTAEAARAAVERDYGAVDWDDQLEARMPGTSTAWWRITELTLAGTGPTGGAR